MGDIIDQNVRGTDLHEVQTFAIPLGQLTLTPLPNGKRRITVQPSEPMFVSVWTWDTAYPPELVKLIGDEVGVPGVCDEIRRDEDPTYLQLNIHDTFDLYFPGETLADKRLMDFGCGRGASTAILGRRFPQAEIVGVELVESMLRIGRARAAFYGLDRVRFLASPSGTELPENIGQFDVIFLNAVYEHLLPDERTALLPRLWAALRPGGRLVLIETPYRYFPLESHTTGLPFINYLPDRLAYPMATRFSKRITPGATWEHLLRAGIRGGAWKTILRDFGPDAHPLMLRPSQGNAVDHWYLTSAKRSTGRKRVAKRVFKVAAQMLYSLTGILCLPEVRMVIQKREAS
ncbi:MAG: class I SAM-dependent methyltransferase [bacterium]|nr:class I SAM-dependent methyltransferase [bacterium]